MIPGIIAGRGAASASDPYWPNVIALLHFDGANGSTPIDQTGRSWSGFGSAPPSINSGRAKFGPSSLLFPTGNVSSGFQAAASDDFNFGTNDLTIEWWQYWSSVTSPRYQAAISHGYSTAGGLTLVTGDMDGRYALQMGASNTQIMKEASAPSTGAWHYYGLTRSGGAFTLRRNGVISATGTSVLAIGASGKRFALGSYASDSGALGQIFNGSFDEVRITKGVARDTSVMPTAPFPNS